MIVPLFSGVIHLQNGWQMHAEVVERWRRVDYSENSEIDSDAATLFIVSHV